MERIETDRTAERIEIEKREAVDPAAFYARGEKRRPELLSPAGDLEGVRAALAAGADAVYLGGALFSARAYAKNLSDEELLEAIDYAHLFDRKVYLACNILLRKRELPQALHMIEPLYERGLDGIIVQDIGLLGQLRERFPDLPLHASTQMAVLSTEGAEWLKAQGVSRVVPGRELSLAELAAIRESGIEVECFVHGAMCYSYSGRCLFSSLAGGRSGNRGRCAGPCRQRYLTERGEAGYYLSMKDMSALERIGELIEIGVDSFKIEGRMKAAEYTAGVTAVYRKYIDRYLETGTIAVAEEDFALLHSLYIRSEKQDGYLHRHNGREMISLYSPAYSATPEELKRTLRERYIEQPPKIDVSMHCYLYAGTRAYLTVEHIGGFVERSGQMLEKARTRATTEEEIARQLCKTGGTPFRVGRYTIGTDGETFVPMGEISALRRAGLEALAEELLKSRRRERAADVSERAADALERTASAPEQAVDASEQASDASEQATDALKRAADAPERASDAETAAGQELPEAPQRVLAGVRTLAQAREALTREELDGVILPLELYAALKKEAPAAEGKALYLRLPEIVRQEELSAIEEQLRQALTRPPRGIYCGSYDALALAGRFLPREQLHAEGGCYVWSRTAARELLRYAGSYTLSDEQNGRELAAISGDYAELILYGYQPLMYSANCIQKTTAGCDRSAGAGMLRDEKGHSFPYLPVHRYCYNILYNCVPLSLHRQLPALLRERSARTLRLEFSIEDIQEMRRLLDYYCAILRGEDAGEPPFRQGAYTQGHYQRGAE